MNADAVPGWRGMMPRAVHVAQIVVQLLTGDRGVAAVEFALILPVALLLYVGAAELSQATMTSRKVMIISSTLVQLTSQQPTSSQALSTPAPPNAISSTKLATIFSAANALIFPASTAPLKMTLSAVDIVNNSAGLCCDAKVRWTYTQSGTLRPCGALTPASPSAPPSPSTIASSMIPPLSTLQSPQSVLIADVSYTYTPVFDSSFISFASGMSRTTYTLPRTAGQVIVAPPMSPSGNQSGQVCY